MRPAEQPPGRCGPGFLVGGRSDGRDTDDLTALDPAYVYLRQNGRPPDEGPTRRPGVTTVRAGGFIEVVRRWRPRRLGVSSDRSQPARSFGDEDELEDREQARGAVLDGLLRQIPTEQCPTPDRECVRDSHAQRGADPGGRASPPLVARVMVASLVLSPSSARTLTSCHGRTRLIGRYDSPAAPFPRRLQPACSNRAALGRPGQGNAHGSSRKRPLSGYDGRPTAASPRRPRSRRPPRARPPSPA